MPDKIKIPAAIRNRLLSPLAFLFFASFVIWLFCFRRFITGELNLTSDALSYYDHTEFFVRNVIKGVYPLWDPSWFCGIPNEFFLRRIGPFNPFIYLMAGLRLIGMPFWQAYLLPLCLYYWVGMIGFYLLAKRLFRYSSLAFVAYLMLMFSSLGTRIFDSYLILIAVPLIWFFYFLISFAQAPHKTLLLGLTLTVILLFTTYIPFYFIFIVLTFLASFIMFYPRNSLNITKTVLPFFKQHFFLTLFCLLAMACALIPGFILFQQTGSGILALPIRHAGATAQHVLGVARDLPAGWAIAEDLLYSSFFTADLSKFAFATFYIPPFIYILFFLGIFAPGKKDIIFLGLWGFFLFLLGIPGGTSLYQFFHDHVFFFKYFRNLHFFLWVIILPVFILFVTGQFQSFLEQSTLNGRKKYPGMLWAATIHVALAAFLGRQGHPDAASILTLILSFFLISFYLWGRPKVRPQVLLACLSGMIVLQPLAAYHFLSLNSKPRPQYLPATTSPFSRNLEYWTLKAIEHERSLIKRPAIPRLYPLSPDETDDLYVATKYYNFLHKNVLPGVFGEYFQNRFYLVDRVDWLPDPDPRWDASGLIDQNNRSLLNIEQMMLRHANIAFIDDPQGVRTNPGRTNPQAEIITENSRTFRILSSNANAIKVKTDLPEEKFLVYTDNWHPSWQAFINGKPAPLFRANVAFKGLWIPAGKNIIYLKYGKSYEYALELLLLSLSLGIFFYLIITTGRSFRKGCLPDER